MTMLAMIICMLFGWFLRGAYEEVSLRYPNDTEQLLMTASAFGGVVLALVKWWFVQ